LEYWETMERELAKRLKGLLTPGSGNKSIKGDVHCDLFVVEAKWRAFTYKEEYYMTLEEDWLKTISRYASKYGKHPMLAICIANVATYYLIRREYWEASDGRLDYITPKTLECPSKQKRLYAKEDFAYTIFQFSEAGEWMALPEGDLFFLVELARRSLRDKLNGGSASLKETQCEKKKQWSRPPREKTEAQLQREKDVKEKMKELRKRWYQQQKAKRSAREKL
jgi:hypothetical protein